MDNHTGLIGFFTAFGKYIFVALGALASFLEPTFPFILVCTLAVFMDCYTAWDLSRRIKKKYPGANDGKFRSDLFGRTFNKLLKIYALIVLAFLIEEYILEGANVRLANIVAGASCFAEIWSMLENESSSNNSKWARIIQKIMVDKTERYFNIDLKDLKEKEDGKN